VQLILLLVRAGFQSVLRENLLPVEAFSEAPLRFLHLTSPGLTPFSRRVVPRLVDVEISRAVDLSVSGSHELDVTTKD
jgi:hypothetical protein